ncbi:ABC transporter ATP-binding protein [Sulfitobacter geojensis]|uniref:ABC transporter ATP-binding protein n=1 Tax=Sulfitobacter geojensis TaxID=1342299 RepID=UPI002491FFAD|nr:ABC transporter ATP-binding protein [Sulfitobacter geojensis]
MFEMHNMTVRFAIGEALRDASLRIAAGDRIGIVGESGSGKSMLAACLMGMVPESAELSGSLTIDGTDMTDASEETWQTIRARRAAMIFQEPMSALNPLRRVGDTVAEPMRVHLGLSKTQARARVIALFEEVGIPDPAARLRMFPHELSGGQRQRVLIALALACDPELLIADEPTTALDANVALKITDLLVHLSQTRNMALVFISHDLAAVARATTDIAVMYGGDIVERGKTAEVLADPVHPYTQGLLAARPDPRAIPRDADGRRRRLPTIPGTVPPLPAMPQGCRFAGRCAVERSECASIKPMPAGPRLATCHAVLRDTP